jgi:hypothetical protein
MNEFEINKIERFMGDREMSDAVYKAILNVFLDDKKGLMEVNVLAASRLAVTFLREAWKEMERFEPKKTVDKEEIGNVGL